MKRIFVVAALALALVAVPAMSALALACPSGQVVWIQAFNSSDGSYKHVHWQGGDRYFSGTGTDYINTNRQSNSFVNISSNSSSTSASEFCVPKGVDFANGDQ